MTQIISFNQSFKTRTLYNKPNFTLNQNSQKISLNPFFKTNYPVKTSINKKSNICQLRKINIEK